jgi:hypothetical protein
MNKKGVAKKGGRRRRRWRRVEYGWRGKRRKRAPEPATFKEPQANTSFFFRV